MKDLDNKELNEFYSLHPFAVRLSDGHEDEWYHFKQEKDCKIFYDTVKEDLNNPYDGYMYKYNKELGYEVIDSFGSRLKKKGIMSYLL